MVERFCNIFHHKLFIDTRIFLLNSTITNYAQTEYNSSSIMMGFIASVFIVGALIGRVLTGFIKITKTIFILNIVIYFVSIILYFVNLGEYF